VKLPIKPSLISSIGSPPSADHPTDTCPPKYKPAQPLCQHAATQPQILPRPLSTTSLLNFHALRIQASITSTGKVFRGLTFGEEKVDEEGDEGAAEEVVYKAVEGLEIKDSGGNSEKEGGEGAERGEDLGGEIVKNVSGASVLV
jgi:hypothetical protein